MSVGSTGISLLASTLGLNLGNLSEYPANSNKYYVALGTFLTSFSKVSGINLKSSQIVPINEGGSNKPYLFRDTKKEFNTITFEKGFGTIDVMSMVDKVSVMTIIIKGNDNSIKGVYYTDRAIVQSVSLSDLDALKSEPLIQTMTVAYNTLKKADKIMTALSFLSAAGGSTSIVDSALSKQARDKAEEEKAQSTKEKELSKEREEAKAKSLSTDNKEKESSLGESLESKNDEIKNEAVRLANNQNKNVDLIKQKEEEEEKLNEEKRIKELEDKIEF